MDIRAFFKSNWVKCELVIMNKKQIKNVLTGAVVGALMYCNSFAVSAQETKQMPKPAVYTSLTEITTGTNPIHRAEVVVKNLPGNSDIYFVYEGCGNNTYFKIRAQEFPIHFDSLELGIAAQHIGGSGSSHQEMGLAARLTKRTPGSIVKANFRYFPATNIVDSYVVWDQRKVLFDVLSSYNTQNGRFSVMPGIDYKFNNNLSLGIETKITGGQTDYTGIRTSVKF